MNWTNAWMIAALLAMGTVATAAPKGNTGTKDMFRFPFELLRIRHVIGENGAEFVFVLR